MNEEYGNLPDGFFLSQEEVNNLRNAKKKINGLWKTEVERTKRKTG